MELLVDCGATSDFMSMQTAKRARRPLYKLRNPGHVLTPGGVQVEVRYYTRAYVRVGELVFRHHFNVLEILPDVVLGLPWLRSYNPTVNWKERYADIQHGWSSYRLSFDESGHTTQLQFHAASKLDLLSILSSSASEASPVGNPTPHAKDRLGLHSSTHIQHGADMYDESATEDGITDVECIDMDIEYISLPKLKRQIRRADLTGDQVFLCCMPRPAVPVDQMYKMQASDDNDGIDPVPRKLPIQLHKWADLYDQEKAEYGDLPLHRPGRDHRIRLNLDDNPPWVHPYKMDPPQLDELRRQLDKLHRSGRIRPSLSPYGAGCLLVRKANGKWRTCVDYRALNTQTVPDWYPLPLIQSILSTLGGVPPYFPRSALLAGFTRSESTNEDIEKTAFNTQFGAFEWVVMPFGLCDTPSTFQRVVNDVL